MPIKIIEPENDAQLQRYFQFRWRLLREPWGQARGSEQDEHEDNAHHIMAVDDNGQIVGVGRLHFNVDHEAQIRYMAVEHNWCRQGIGTAILGRLEQIAQQNKVRAIVLNARSDVVDFYLKYGYQIIEPGETLFDAIDHVKMRKVIEFG